MDLRRRIDTGGGIRAGRGAGEPGWKISDEKLCSLWCSSQTCLSLDTSGIKIIKQQHALSI